MCCGGGVLVIGLGVADFGFTCNFAYGLMFGVWITCLVFMVAFGFCLLFVGLLYCLIDCGWWLLFRLCVLVGWCCLRLLLLFGLIVYVSW